MQYSYACGCSYGKASGISARCGRTSGTHDATLQRSKQYVTHVAQHCHVLALRTSAFAPSLRHRCAIIAPPCFHCEPRRGRLAKSASCHL
ncbi:unnamed protein product [Chondrus crispus]|uniref:Uncharacterized protein n=1 Tax=Chondrus crispus TaxID=2769 RepID=R7QBV7_CHOCR|nr:unnamed protein product [Chondrus crispus]CDF35534.1 unnamed protein product [Chondrus crispus]|eukprot:XP_005715353.1 unnamed protein product [Chondrus crispus]